MLKGIKKAFINGFESYQINERGEIHLLNYYYSEYGYHPELTKRIDRAGYLTVRLSKEGKTYTKYLHRLIAEHFVRNPLELPEVNHKDGNKLNNSPANLEWVSHRSNVLHAYRSGLNKKAELSSKRVINIETGEEYKSIKEASKQYELPYSTLKNLLNGSRKNKTNLKVLSKPVI